MISLFYKSPFGEWLPVPSTLELVDSLRKLPDEHWNSHVDTGFATLESQDNGRVITQLVFTKKNDYGVHMTYRDCRIRLVADGSFYMQGNNDWNDVATLFLAGEEIYIPRALFVSVDEASRVLIDYCSNGEVKDLRNWISVRSLRWDVEAGKAF